MAKLLLEQGQCSVDPLNNRRQTPLILAVSQGHASLVELLVRAGADVKAAGEDGDTGIHVACLKLHSLQGEANITSSPNVYHVFIILLYVDLEKCIICQHLVYRFNRLFNHKGVVLVIAWPLRLLATWCS